MKKEFWIGLLAGILLTLVLGAASSTQTLDNISNTLKSIDRSVQALAGQRR